MPVGGSANISSSVVRSHHFYEKENDLDEFHERCTLYFFNIGHCDILFYFNLLKAEFLPSDIQDVSRP